ncbi:MAG: DUF427 domain-containing protein [Chitinophagales bacterium]|nr:DUF427 domain-containing protein [Chitinophagales bacterium]
MKMKMNSPIGWLYYDIVVGDPLAQQSAWCHKTLKLPARSIREFITFYYRLKNYAVESAPPQLYYGLRQIVVYRLVGRRGSTIQQFKELGRVEGFELVKLFSTKKWEPDFLKQAQLV